MRVLLAVFTSLMLMGCDGAHEKLELLYDVKSIPEPITASQTSLSIRGPHQGGTQVFRDIVTVSATESGIGVEVGIIFTSAILIPTEEVTSCAMTCFGTQDRHIDFIVPSNDVLLSFPTHPVLEDWCWTHKKQIFPDDLVRGWMYEGGELPPRDPSAPQFSSREAYNKQLFQSCIGY